MLRELLVVLKDEDHIDDAMEDIKKRHRGEHFLEVLKEPEHLAEIIEEEYQDKEDRQRVSEDHIP